MSSLLALRGWEIRARALMRSCVRAPLSLRHDPRGSKCCCSGAPSVSAVCAAPWAHLATVTCWHCWHCAVPSHCTPAGDTAATSQALAARAHRWIQQLRSPAAAPSVCLLRVSYSALHALALLLALPCDPIACPACCVLASWPGRRDTESDEPPRGLCCCPPPPLLPSFEQCLVCYDTHRPVSLALPNTPSSRLRCARDGHVFVGRGGELPCSHHCQRQHPARRCSRQPCLVASDSERPGAPCATRI